MFSEEFYPTPKNLLARMLKRFEMNADVLDRLQDRGNHHKFSCFSNKAILDPSAGKGDILDYITENSHYVDKPDNFSAIEKNIDLQSVLREKEYPVIASDFLDYNDDVYFDYIIMNPPFSNGDEHLLHAIKIAKNTEIVCVLNAQTIKNPGTKRRKLLLEQINNFGEVEFVQDAFKDAERQTGVEVAIVYLNIQKEDERFNFDFEDFEDSGVNTDFDIANNEVAREDLIGNLNLRYEEVRKSYAEFLKAEAKYKHYKKIFLEGESFHSEGDWQLEKGTPQQKYTFLSGKLKGFMWRKVIKQLDVEKYMSSKVLSNFNAFINQQTKMAFTKENVGSFFQTIMGNRKMIWDKAVVDVFDMLTDFYKDNRNHVEGWRTNDKFKINRKIILPNWCKWNTAYMNQQDIKDYGAYFEVDYRDRTKYEDIDKVMAYLSGESLKEQHKINFALEQHFSQLGKVRTGEKIDNVCDSKYFDIKFFRKGTVHLTFKDKKLWNEFNMTACASKNWLPDDEKTKWEEAKKERREKRKQDQKPEQQLLFANSEAA